MKLTEQDKAYIAKLVERYPDGTFDDFEEWAPAFVATYNVISASVPTLLDVYLTRHKRKSYVMEGVLKALDKLPDEPIDLNKRIKPDWMP